ncbi:RHS repeat-associated core domain-containing protein [Cedecea sp.]|jgi:RHS repeat-associated protein|uniref:RHS repeat-associated core domain-containing protein n=1 Tax=Cedecea sp. TaxID=1970739 RepID=UPI002F3EAAB4
MSDMVLGFNGERLDPVTGTTHLGNGYRAYSPVLMRFICPDSWSPFGEGGINPYAYCDGDPVNRVDPTGHFSVGGAIGAVIGFLGILFTPFTGGSSLAAVLSVASVFAGAASVGLGIASELVSDPKTAAGLGWAGFALGILSGVGAFAVGKLAPQAKSLGSLLGGRLMKSATGLQQRVRAYQRSKINVNLHPESAQPLFFRRAFNIKAITKNNKIVDREVLESVYTNIAGTGEPGIRLHGNSGVLSLPENRFFTDMDSFAAFVKEKYKIDLATFGGESKPLHLFSCFSNKNAPRLSDALERPVVGYGNNEILTMRVEKFNSDIPITSERYLPRTQRRVTIDGRRTYEFAASELFEPGPHLHTLYGID